MNTIRHHWSNPWPDVVYVPIEELAECDAGLGHSCCDVDGTSFILTKERILNMWRERGAPLDAYILPSNNGEHCCIGIRYGSGGDEYLSPMGDRAKVEALLRRYQ